MTRSKAVVVAVSIALAGVLVAVMSVSTPLPPPAARGSSGEGDWDSRWLTYATIALGLAAVGTLAFQIRQSRLSRDRSERVAAYGDLLARQDERTTIHRQYRTAWNECNRHNNSVKKDQRTSTAHGRALHAEVADLATRIEVARQGAWAALARVRLLASQDVVKAADEWTQALNADNPRHIKKPNMETSVGHEGYKVLESAERSRLHREFTVAARRDLGAQALKKY